MLAGLIFGHLWELIRNAVDPENWGPNVPPSLMAAAIVVLHNEVRVARRDLKHHASTRQIVHDELRQVLHPAEEVEEHVAEDVAHNMRKGANAENSDG